MEGKKNEELLCTCSGIQSTTQSFKTREGDIEKTGSKKMTVGNVCTCGEKVFNQISLSFEGPTLLPEEEINLPSLFESGRSRPFPSTRSLRRRMNDLFDDMERSFY
jgi:hypothetical protein